MEKGYFALVLHAHLPYVRHHDRDDYLEERWVYEAMLESYIPLLLVFDRLAADGVDFRLTLSLSPTLLSMLADPLVRDRFRVHLGKCVELAAKEVKRTSGSPAENRVARMYLERFREAASYCGKVGYDLVSAFRRLQEQGYLELITSAATHAFLPHVETEEAIRAQIRVGVDTYERFFGRKPKGFWLPECGYTPGVDRLLKEAGISYVIVETHAIEHATPQPRRGIYAPLLTEFGVAAFARDPECSRQVWSAETGYPGDFDYREYYRDIGFDLDESYIGPYIHPAGIRVNTGIKYYRITGKDGHKEIYHPDWAREKAALHAGHFLFNRERQIEYWHTRLDRKPIIVAPYDAELFGHWWYEGPMFLEFLCRKIACDTQVFRMVTPSEYLDEYRENDRARLPMSSWGRNGYGEVWLNGSNEWIYRHLHRAEREMVRLAETHAAPSPLQRRALMQAARELMLAQSSDWAFIMDNRSVVEYAARRTHDHLVRFFDLCRRLDEGNLAEAELAAMEQAFPLFPDLNPAYYLPRKAHTVNVSQSCIAAAREAVPALRVLMLSWEFPPLVVGGLSRAVYDLSRHLAKANVEVHVLTREAPGAPDREAAEGVYVHRVRTYQPDRSTSFLDWVFQMNLAMADEIDRLLKAGIQWDLIHAHDWLVGHAAIEAKRRYGLPLVATIHAMEHGRHQGIHTPLQERIHQAEWELTCEAQRVIACSEYMSREMQRLFAVPEDKIAVIPNGVELPPPASEEMRTAWQRERSRFALPEEKIVFFVGRMVREKGVHLLLAAAPELLRYCPEAKFVLAGTGPALDEYKRIARERGIGEKVLFLGFVEDEVRNLLYRLADLVVFPSLYEPFGIVALEAMAHGAPLLVADTGGLAEIVRHGENGLKMYAGDVASLTAQMRWALAHPDETRKLARHALTEVAIRYDWTKLAGDTLDLYRSLVPEREDHSARSAFVRS